MNEKNREGTAVCGVANWIRRYWEPVNYLSARTR